MPSQIEGYERIPASIQVNRNGNMLQITETYEFLVYSDDRLATRQEILFQTPGLPRVGVLYTQNGLICESVSASRKEENYNYWIVTSNFSSGQETMVLDPNNPSADPTTWLPIFQMNRFEQVQKVLEEDFSNPTKPIVNALGIKFATPVTVTKRLPVIEWTQYEPADVKMETILKRSNCVNSLSFDVITPPFHFFGAKQLLININGCAYGTWYGYTAWKVEYEAVFDDFSWELDLMEVSPVYKDNAGKLVPYYDDTNTIRIYGNIIGSGVDKGKKKLIGAAMDPTPDYTSFNIYKPIDFKTFVRGIQ